MNNETKEKIKEEIKDILEMSKIKDVNIEILLFDSFRRGVIYGKELAKDRMRECIEKEK